MVYALFGIMFVLAIQNLSLVGIWWELQKITHKVSNNDSSNSSR